jgi:hypothetical protein
MEDLQLSGETLPVHQGRALEFEVLASKELIEIILRWGT